jgi:hypothetical protein
MPAFLARRYAVATEVERRDDEPTMFTWHGRRYVVSAVLDHWWETAAWWTGDAVQVGDDEREMWRVEAAAAHGDPAAGALAIVELCFAWSTGVWTVDRVLD